MLPSLTLLIFARVVLSVSTNAVQKHLILKKAGVNMIWIATYSLMLIPAFLIALIRPAPSTGSFWPDILTGGLLDAIGNLAMVAALRATDLSIFGPLNAFRPILALAFGWSFLGEAPTTAGLAGVGITVTGAVVLLRRTNAPQGKADRRHMARVLLLRLAGLSLSTSGAVFIKKAAKAGTAEWALAGWILCGLASLMAIALFRGQRIHLHLQTGLQRHRDRLLLHAAFFLAMQWITIRIFQHALLAYSFVFFQLGMILQVIAGRVYFREPAFRRRILGCAIMGLGGALILWKG